MVLAVINSTAVQGGFTPDQVEWRSAGGAGGFRGPRAYLGAGIRKLQRNEERGRKHAHGAIAGEQEPGLSLIYLRTKKLL